MTQPKHTPAPWYRNIKSDDARYSTIFAGRNTHIATAKGHGSLPFDEIEANVSLLATAPELLKALELAGQWLWTAHDMGMLSGEEFAHDIDEIDKTIAKARGE